MSRVCRVGWVVLRHAAIAFAVIYAAAMLVAAAIFEPELMRWVSALVLPLLVAGVIADLQEQRLRAMDEKLDRLLDEQPGGKE